MFHLTAFCKTFGCVPFFTIRSLFQSLGPISCEFMPDRKYKLWVLLKTGIGPSLCLVTSQQWVQTCQFRQLLLFQSVPTMFDDISKSISIDWFNFSNFINLVETIFSLLSFFINFNAKHYQWNRIESAVTTPMYTLDHVH